MEHIEKKLDKKETIWYSGIAILIILMAFILKFIFIFPIAWASIWIYGIIFLVGGIGAYFISLFFLRKFSFLFRNL